MLFMVVLLRPFMSTQVCRRVEDVLFLQPQGICLKCHFSVGLLDCLLDEMMQQTELSYIC